GREAERGALPERDARARHPDGDGPRARRLALDPAQALGHADPRAGLAQKREGRPKAASREPIRSIFYLRGPRGPRWSRLKWPRLCPPPRGNSSRPSSSPGAPTGASAISASSSSLERACLRESLILPIGSTAMILTVTSSPSLTTSVVCRTRYGASSEMCTRPSWPGRISTKAPYASTRRTLPL